MREKCFGDELPALRLPLCGSIRPPSRHPKTHPKTFQLRTIAALPEPAGRPTHGLLSRRSTDRISTSPLANFAKLSMFRFDGLNIQNVFLPCNTKCIIGAWFCDNKLYSKVIYFCALVLETKNRGVRIHLALAYL